MKKIKNKLNKYNISALIIVIFALFMSQFGIYLTYLITLTIIGCFFLINRSDKMKKNNKPIKKNKNKSKSTLKKVAIGFLSVFIFGLVLLMAFAGLIIVTAPEFDPNNMARKESTTLYDKDGQIIAKLGLEKRELITYDQLPDVLVDAIVATEDARFFQHNGFDLPRFAVASFGQLMGRNSGGASTLTMQVSKNNYTSDVASGFEGIKRKFTDIYMAIFKIEKNYTKEEILEFYVNQNNLGAGAYGVQQASLTYFGKDAKDLNLSEAALIAGLFQAPSAYNPYINPESASKRRATVLYLMERHGYITNDQRKIANDIPVETLLNKKNQSGDFQAFIDTVVEEVISLTKKDPYIVSMDIYTTMNREKQLYVNDIMNGNSYKWRNDVVDAGIAVLDNSNGSIAAIGAGRHRSGQRQFNNATMIKRQIGSTAKPIYDYAMGIEKNNWSSYDLFVDEPHSYSSGGSIKNWDSKYEGLLTLRVALARSRNIPALKAFQATTNKDIRDFVTSIGLSPELENGRVHEAHALGGYNGESPLTMAAAYSVFANGGFYTKPYSFSKIIFKEDNKEFINNPEKKRVISEATAYIMSDMLIDSAKHGLGSNSNINGTIYGAKTGTTNFSSATMREFKFPSSAINDHWVVGTSPDFAVGVWYGYDKIYKDYYTLISSREHVKLFQKVGQGFFKKGSSFVKSNDVVEVKIEKDTWPAMLPSNNTPSNMIVTEMFVKGTEPTEVSKRFATLDAPTNLKYDLIMGKATLTWNKIDTPQALDDEYLNKYLSSLYKSKSFRTNAFNKIKEWNSKNIGEIGYNIYKKDVAGNLSLLGFTKENKFEFNILTPTTFVVKSTYSIFKASESSGVETTVTYFEPIGDVSAILNGDATVNIDKDEQYVEQNVTVYENGQDITTKPNVLIIRTIKKDGNVTTSVSSSGIYTITYDVSYKSFNKKLERFVIVQ